MTASERRENIISMLRRTNFIKIADIVSTFDVSNETARRDLDYLRDQMLVRRVYGGAVLEEWSPQSVLISRKSTEDSTLNAIGRAAAELVRPGDSVFIGNGSTTLQVARHLRDKSGLTVVTNSLAVINELADSEVTTFILGGSLSHGELDISGELTSECIRHFYCDKAIFGCGGATLEHGIMDFNTKGAPIHSQLIARSKQHILVTNSKKFGSPAFVTACSFDDVDVVVTDTRLSPEYQSTLQERGIRLLLVEADSDSPF